MKQYIKVYRDPDGNIKHVYRKDTPFEGEEIQDADCELEEEELEIDADDRISASTLFERGIDIPEVKAKRALRAERRRIPKLDVPVRPQPTVEEIEARIAQAQSDLAELKRSS